MKSGRELTVAFFYFVILMLIYYIGEKKFVILQLV